MKNNSIKFLLGFIFLSVIIGSGGLIVYTLTQNNQSQNIRLEEKNKEENNQNGTRNQQNEENTNQSTSEKKINDIKTVSDLILLDYNNKNINWEKARRLQIIELQIMEDFLKKLNGASYEPTIPFKAEDMDQAKLKSYVDYSKKADQILDIPKELEPLYLEDKEEALKVVKATRASFFNFLKANGVAQKYLDEFNRSLKETNMFYHADDDEFADYTHVEGSVDENGEKDYSTLDLHINSVDVWNSARRIQDSNIFEAKKNDPNYNRIIRDAGIRLLTSHELTHVLQHAVANAHLKNDKDRFRINAWDLSERTLTELSSQLFWNFGTLEYANRSGNKVISQESQAEGMSIAVFTTMYNLSDVQYEALWDHLFGRYENMVVVLNNVKDLMKKYPDKDPTQLDDLLKPFFNNSTISDGKILGRAVGRLGGLDSYIGYLNPASARDIETLIEFLR